MRYLVIQLLLVCGLSSKFRGEMLFKYVYCSMNMNYDKIYKKKKTEKERDEGKRKIKVKENTSQIRWENKGEGEDITNRKVID